MRTFVIADSSKRKAKPVGIITWKPGLEDNQGVFALELCSDCDEESLPLSLSFCTRRENRCATAKESEDWVNSRIVPESRHNISEVLRANKLTEYDRASLLAACKGRSSDDDLLVYEINVPQEFVTARERTNSSGSEVPGELNESGQSLADRIVSAVRRRHTGTEVSYAFVGLGGKTSRLDDSAHGLAGSFERENPSAAQRIGALIRAERRKQELTQKQLATRAGITQTVLSRTESGTGNPTLSLLEEIAAALGTRLDISLAGCEHEHER